MHDSGEEYSSNAGCRLCNKAFDVGSMGERVWSVTLKGRSCQDSQKAAQQISSVGRYFTPAVARPDNVITLYILCQSFAVVLGKSTLE